jgi:hypothetical protein
MDYQKAERVAYLFSIWDFRNFGQSEAQMLNFVQPLFSRETEFSSNVNCQNSVTSKPLSEQSHMGNGKSGRVAQCCGVQLQDRIPREQFYFRFFLTTVLFIQIFVFYFPDMTNLWLVMFSWLCFR